MGTLLIKYFLLLTFPFLKKKSDLTLEVILEGL